MAGARGITTLEAQNKILSELRQGLVSFWDSQLQVRQEGNSFHIAYPLLHPNGWQISFTLECLDAPARHFRLTDNGRILRWLKDVGVSGQKFRSYLQERCAFFGVTLDQRELTCVSANKMFTPTEIELYAEGLQAIAYLYYRAEPHSQGLGVVRQAFETILQSTNVTKRHDTVLKGRLISEIHFDYVVESTDVTACKLFERKTDLRQSLEIWGFRFHDLHEYNPHVKRLVVYNPEVGRWDDETIQLAQGICDEFIPYDDGQRIKHFLHAA